MKSEEAEQVSESIRAESSSNEILRHPIEYTIFKPNGLIQSDRNELKGMEIRVYNEILNHNHRNTPEDLIYTIPYHMISYDPSKNGARDRKRIGQALQKRSIYLDEDWAQKFLGEKNARSITPFPEVVYADEGIEIHLNPKFKKVLTMLETGFTKGDIITLRGFVHDISHRFYWVARQQQTFRNVWKVSVEDFRDILKITAYTDWRNFKRRILDDIQKDMIGTWMEFDLELKKKGRGSAVKELIFKFKKGPSDEKDKPVGAEFPWEKSLKNVGVDDRVIKQFRSHVKTESETDLGNGTKWIWDSDYIRYSCMAAWEEKEAKENDPKRKNIQKFPAYLVSGLIDGRWINYVLERKQEHFNRVQGDLFNESKE